MVLSKIEEIKIRLMVEGMAVDPGVRNLALGPLTLAEYASTSGVILVLPDEVWVNAPIAEHNPNFVVRPSIILSAHEDELVLQVNGEEIPVRFSPMPQDHETMSRLGAVIHADRVRISPVDGCAVTCLFCNIPYEDRYQRREAADLLQGITLALHDEVVPAQHILISGGTPQPGDYDWLNEMYERVANAFRATVDIMMVPEEGLLDPGHLKEIGIHGLSINLEVYNQEVARRIMAGKWKVGLDRYLNFIGKAVEIFGEGKVRSLLLVGIESLEDTLRGVSALAERGCDPVLSPFRPDPATPLRNNVPPSIELLREAWERSIEIVGRYSGVVLGPRCIPCTHNTLTFPDDSGRYYYSRVH
ncbi:radical SAM protein [Patescibacteria group bacterium]|nr:radical SAM protein [Patescibacteria group bacterium]